MGLLGHAGCALAQAGKRMAAERNVATMITVRRLVRLVVKMFSPSRGK
jgi:hypothetical protein